MREGELSKLLESRRLKHELTKVAYIINTISPPLLLLENDLVVMGNTTLSIVTCNKQMILGIFSFQNFLQNFRKTEVL